MVSLSRRMNMTVETDELGPGWNSVAPTPKGGKRSDSGISLFMKLEPRDEPYHFRLACTPITFRKHRWAFRQLKQWPISPASDRDQKDLDIAWKEGNFIPVERCAAFVFDRDNDNRLRILEEGKEVFGAIYDQGQVSKINPASATRGWDWIASVKEEKSLGQNGKEVKSRKYSVSVDLSKNGPTPLTDEEREALTNPKFQKSELADRYFVKATPEEIKDLWDQLPISARKNESMDGKKSNTNAKTASTSAPQPKPAAPAKVTPKEPPVEPPVELPVAKSVAQTVIQPEANTELDDDNFLVEDDNEEPARMF
jgi:hypothetical protein